MKLTITDARVEDVAGILELREAVDADMAERFGDDRWSPPISEASVMRLLKSPRVLVGRSRGKIVALLRMETKKPWAIDLTYFTSVPKAAYLLDVEVLPRLQNKGLGRQLIDRAGEVAREWGAGAVRLDAYDGASGGGSFYARCGFKEVGRITYRTVPLIYYERLL